ncbi:MAG: ABC transporter permease [Alphaproteobacteria bacterium]|nr:ABC transporter permease [Alphaproteobacteria bacterium]
MRAFAAIFYKEVLHILRDSRSLAAALVLPLLQLVLFGFAIEIDVRNVELAVVDYDRTAASRELVSELAADGSVRVVARPASEDALEALLDAGDVRIGLVVPSGYGRLIHSGEAAPVQLLVDGSDASFAGLALGHVGGSLQHDVVGQIRDVVRVAGGGDVLPGLHVRTRVLFNEDLDGTWYIIPGLIAVIIAMLAAMLTSQCIAREYEQDTIEQILVSPVSGLALMLGKLLPYVGVGLLQVLSVTLAARFVFGVPIRGDLALLGVATLLYLVGAMALGLVLSAVLKSQQVALQLSMVATMLPSLLLSGFVFPISNMHPVLQAISTIIPARYYIAITRGLFLKGTGIDVLWPQLVAMSIFAVVMLIVATSRFRRSLS